MGGSEFVTREGRVDVVGELFERDTGLGEEEEDVVEETIVGWCDW